MFWKFFWWLFTDRGQTFIEISMATVVAMGLITLTIIDEKMR